MHYTQSQFRRVQHQFLQEFQLKTLDFYDRNVNSNNLIEYKKILNQMKTRRKDTIEKKQKYQWLHRRGNTVDISSFGEREDNQSNQLNNKQLKDDEEDQGVGFYLTQNIFHQNKKKKQPAQLLESRQKQNPKPILQGSNSRDLQKSQAEAIIEQHPDNQNLNIDNLNDRIYGQYSVLECLRHEESQVQEAIFCFKKRIIAMEQHLNSEEIKSKQVDRLLVQNNNQMLRAKHTNQQVKSAFLKTKKHFDLDLQGRKQIQVKFGDKNKEEFDESIVNHIYLKKMKQHITQQERQLQKLDGIRHQLQKKQGKYKSIYLKQQQLYKAYEEIREIDEKQFTKKPIVSILDKDFDQFDVREKDHSKNKKTNKITIKQAHNNAQSNKKKLSSVVRQIVELYRRMKHKQASRINQFKQLINQRDQKQSQHTKIVSRMSQIYQTLFQQTLPVNLQDKLRLQQLLAQINQISTKKNLISTTSNSIQYRLKYYMSKQLNIIKKIIATWMKGDKLAAKYIQSISMKLFDNAVVNQSPRTMLSSNASSPAFKAPYQQQNEERQLSIDDSRNLLIGSFQNWQQYVGFLDILHQSSYIYRYMNKTKLFKLFKRIIKTKIFNKNIPTEDIFEKAWDMTFDEGRNLHLNSIQNLLNVFRDLFIYFKKVQSGSIRLSCAIHYDNPLQAKQTQPNESSKLQSRNQLERYSTKKQLTLGNDRSSLGKKFQITDKSKELKNMFPQTKNFLLPSNMKDEDVISKLKKKKQLKPVLNIHDFYEDLREEIQKVNKISAY